MKTTLSDAQLGTLLEIYRGVHDEDFRTFTMPGRAAFVGDAAVVIVDARWAHILGRLLFSKSVPPSDRVLVANATGVATTNRTLVAALRGGGWNVPSSVDQPTRTTTAVYGSGGAANVLAEVFGVPRKAMAKTTVVVGSDFAPEQD